MHPNVVWIGNQKGGVGKTTLSAQLGGLSASAGWRVLLIDADPQGNLARHLGVIAQSDGGRNLFDAVADGVPLLPLRDVRPGLDLVPSGDRWSLAIPRLLDLAGQGRGLEAAVAPLAGEYDLIIVDTPPTAGPVHDAVGLLSHYMVVVTAFDDSSLDGLRGTFRAALDLRKRPLGNPWLEVLGVVVFGVPTQATTWRKRVQDELRDMLGDAIPVFVTMIRDMPTTAAALQRQGLLVTEGETVADDQTKRLFQRLRGELGSSVVPDRDDAQPRLTPKSIGGLTDDYLSLTKQLQELFAARQALYVESS